METKVALIMGSSSDFEFLKPCISTLEHFGVSFEVRVLSAHRTPVEASEYASTAAERGIKVILAAAGGAAHLAGVLAGHTTLPVIGIPVKGGALNGIDSLLATLQMPSGIPVPTVTLGSAGPVNAAIFAIQVLALSDSNLANKLSEYKKSLKNKVYDGDREVQKALNG